MARPKNKEELLRQGEENYLKLITLINSLSEKEQVGTFPFEGRDRQIRDCLVHLYEWHQLFLSFIQNNQQDIIIPFLPEPYNWRNYGEMNLNFWNQHQETSLEDAKKILETSHKDCLEVIKQYSDEELFTKKYFKWTGTTSLGSYAVSATSSHYDWAFKIVKKYKKGLK